MDATTLIENPAARVVQVEGLMGRLLGRPIAPQPVGRDTEQWMRTHALMTEGINIYWTPYRPADISGARPEWYEFTHNVGDIDAAPLVFPLGPRHRSIGG